MNTTAVKTVMPGLRRVMILISVLDVVVGQLLYLLPFRTDKLFAWTILPPVTAMFLGGAYITALVISQRGARERVWSSERAIYPGLLLFTVLTLLATLLHLDKFHFQSPELAARLTAWAWVIVYILVPALMAALLVLQIRQPGLDMERRTRLPRPYRAALIVEALLFMTLGITLFLWPQLANSLWPWQLTPLTAAAVGSWLIGLGFAVGHSALENAWERVGTAVISHLVLGTLELFAILRFASDVHWNAAASWVYVIVCAAMIALGLFGLYRRRGLHSYSA